MKKSLKKLSLNKKAVSNLTVKIIGGKAKNSGSPFTCLDTKERTICIYCLPPDPY